VTAPPASVTVVIDNQAVCLPVGYSLVFRDGSLSLYCCGDFIVNVVYPDEGVRKAWAHAEHLSKISFHDKARRYMHGDRAYTAYEHVCASLGYAKYAQDIGYVSFDGPDDLIGKVMALQIAEAEDLASRTMQPKDEWTEDDGNVLWWSLPLREPPYAGTPLDDDFPEHLTHWTRIPPPIEPAATEETEP
jgi:hypothetical protein